MRGEKEVKLADFGCCKGVFAEAPHTEYISTRWYRPPECLLTDGYYDSKVGAREQIDIWGVGCVLYEIITGDPLFKGEDEMDQINKIHDVMGTPHPEVLAFYQEYQALTRLASHMEFNFEEKKGAGLRAMLPEDRSSEDLLDLLARMLAYEPHTRISAGEALRHPFFLEVVEKEMELEKSTL